MNLGTYPKCNDSRRCFAKQIEYVNEKKVTKCSVLCSSYKLDGECAFCKPDAEVTKGKYYPNNKNYGRERTKPSA